MPMRPQNNIADEFKLDQHITDTDRLWRCVHQLLDRCARWSSTNISHGPDSNGYKGLLSYKNQRRPAGMAFLLATIAGTPNWEEFWAQLRTNDVAVTSGWKPYYGTS